MPEVHGTTVIHDCVYYRVSLFSLIGWSEIVESYGSLVKAALVTVSHTTREGQSRTSRLYGITDQEDKFRFACDEVM